MTMTNWPFLSCMVPSSSPTSLASASFPLFWGNAKILLLLPPHPFSINLLTAPPLRSTNPDSTNQRSKMVLGAIKQVSTILMQLVWKVVRPADLHAGDHIYRYGFCGTYSHHGIYVGSGSVIHYTRTEAKKTICPSLSKSSNEQQSCPNFPKCEIQTIKRGVIKTCLDCFRRDDQKLQSLHRYEYGWSQVRFMLARRGTCTTIPFTKPHKQVVKKAIELHASNAFGNYNLINNNCEHFAIFCRTDVRKSEQAALISNCGRKIMEATRWITRLLQGN